MIRRTRQRDAILQSFQQAQRPLAVNEIHELAARHCPSLGLRTVYRQLNELAREGQVAGVDYPGQPLRYTLVHPAGHRAHIICRKCRRVFDIDAPVQEAVISKPPPHFVINGQETIFYGLCPACARPPD